ncbi:MAG: hypothetical protein ACRD3S_16285 [Terracidiphilus sp.]
MWRRQGPAAVQIAVCLVFLVSAVVLAAQTASPAEPPSQSTTTVSQSAPSSSAQNVEAGEAAQPRPRDKRRAAKLYLAASKLFMDRKFEEAMKDFEQAAALDPAHADYKLAAGVARGHLVTALVQQAAKDRLTGNEAAARTALEQARALDPDNIEVVQHLDEMADYATRSEPRPLYEQSDHQLAEPPQLEPTRGAHSFHMHRDSKQVITEVFKAYGITAMIDSGVHSISTRFDVDDLEFSQAARAVGLATNTFFVPVDAHRALVALNTPASRNEFLPEDTETVYLTGLSDDEMNDVLTVAKNIFAMPHASLATTSHTLLLRAPDRTLESFNTTLQSLLDGRSQVVLDVRIIQVAHTGERNTGVQLPQTMTAFNVLAEEQSLLNQNASLVQEIISSGLAPANDPLAILGILIASGAVPSSLLQNGFAVFGGGITQSALELGSFNVNLNLNTSDSRELDDVQLRLGDGEKGTLKLGEKYPIQTASFSSVGPSLPAGLAGLSAPGASGNLSSLLSSLTSSVPNVPMVQYEDLGLTLTVTPKALRNDDVALTVEMKLDALSGTFVNGNPILDNRAYSGVVTLKEGEATVVATELDKSQSRSISGTPGLSEIPGLNNISEKNMQTNYATLVIVMTPHVVRGPQAAGHTAMMMVERGAGR